MGLSCTEYFNCMTDRNESFSHFSSSRTQLQSYLAYTRSTEQISRVYKKY